MLFGAVWVIAVPAWMFASPDVLAGSISGERATSTKALLFFSACILAFLLGAVAAGTIGGGRPARQPRPAGDGLVLAARLIALAAVLGGGFWLFRSSMRVGGPANLLHLFLTGYSIADLKVLVYTPSQFPPFTTMVHLSPAAASLLLYLRSQRGWHRVDRLLFIAVVAVGCFRGLLMAERLAMLGVLSAIVVTLLLTARDLKPSRVALWAAGGAGLVWFVWSAGEFSRSWIDSGAGDSSGVTVSNFVSSLSYSQTRLGQYLFTAINNGIIIVNEWPGQSFPANFAPPLNSLGPPGLGGGAGAQDLYRSALSREFTGESMPGAFYLDAREFGFALALVYGVFFGLAWRSAVRLSPAGIVLYASTVMIILDSYRSAYLFSTQGIAGMVAAAVVYAALHAPARRIAHRGAREAVRRARFTAAPGQG
ncbi:MAG: hypothetical protein HY875_06680 [Chloroflexi bacterium]|nr:hypothetical protein [Chloroflexota bacterium]